MSRTSWTPEQLAALRERYPHEKSEVIARDIGRTVRSVYQKALALGLKKTPEFLRSGLAGRLDGVRGGKTRFQKGQAAWNKGVAFNPGGRSAETRFKKGQKPHTWVPVGAERVTKDGYLQRKVTDTGYPPKDWKSVHQIVWEEANGPLPAGCVVVFKPGKKTLESSTIKTADLEMLTRSELMRRNTRHNLPKELNEVIQLRAVLTRQINKRSKEHEQNH